MIVDSSSYFAGAAALLREAVGAGAFPGAAFGVLHRGELLAAQGIGQFTFEPHSLPVTAGTLFDLASVTKVVATTAMAMLLWQRGRLALDAPLAELLPEFAGDGPDQVRRRRVTLRMLLSHTGGVPAYQPFFLTCPDREAALSAAFRLPLIAEPGTHAAYSDPGFILLGAALERIAGEPLDVFCRREIFHRLEMENTIWRPMPELWPAIPPTEEDTSFRKRRIQGEVHDENCWVLGGVSGHAGLFAPVSDVLRFAEAMLAPLRAGAAETLFQAETVRLFTTRVNVPAGSSRALGWDTPSGSPSSSGTRFSRASFGHLGYTGTSLWIDPVQDLSVVLLTNRTFPTRENKKIQEVRPVFHDAVVDAVLKAIAGRRKTGY